MKRRRNFLRILASGAVASRVAAPAKATNVPRAPAPAAAAGAGAKTGEAAPRGSPMLRKPIPSSGEPLPVITGRLLEETGARSRAFVATKVWTSGREAGIRQMEESFRLLRTKTIDLMQVHTLVDWRAHLPLLREWKAQGRIRYLGVTHYTSSAYPQLEQVLRSEALDFVQLNYSIDDRTAEERILPLAAERGIAVLVNRPFGGGGLLRSLSGRPLPAWAGETGCESWAQALLKFVVSHPSVNCAIPGTGNPAHMRANAQAGMGPMPDEAMRRRMIADAAARK